MPIRPELRWFYPIDWPQISRHVRFERAGGVCQGCGRPHGANVRCLPDGRWFDTARHAWRDDHGRPAPVVNAAHNSPKQGLIGDELERFVSADRGGHVGKGEGHAGDDLDREGDEGGAPEDIPPVDVLGDRVLDDG